MIQLKEWSEKTIRREVYEFEEPHGYWEADTWTRVTVNGELDRWIPHDDYGELPEDGSSLGEDSILEEKFQNSAHS
jgi:hypothetical protein